MPRKAWLHPSLASLVFFHALIVVATFTLWGCGGGGAGGGAPPAPTPDFSLSFSTTNPTVAAGGSVTITVTVTGSNGFTEPVATAVSGLPSGVTVSPTSLQITPGQSGKLTFTAATYLSASTTSLTLNASSTGNSYVTHSATMSLAVTPYAGNTTLPRTHYTRTDAVTEYFLWPNSNWIVFNSNTNRFFVTDPSSNRVFALDATTRALIGGIVVPGAYGIDETPDQTTLYVGTQIGDIYAIDPVSMTVTKRYMASQIGPNGFMAYSARVLANGSLALLGGQGGIPGVDGYGEFAVWNPATNSISIYGENAAIPCGQQAGGIFEFSVTGDRSLVLLVIGNGSRVCTIDPVTGAANSYVSPANDFGGYPVVATPDGKSILVFQQGTIVPGPPPQVIVLDAKTLSQKSTITLSADSTGTSAMIASADSKTVYVSEDSWTGIVYAYDIASGTLLGWSSNLYLPPTSGGSASGPIGTPAYEAVDNTGLLAGPMEEGVGFLDTTALQTGPVGPDVLNGYLVPATGLSAGGTTTLFASFSELDTVYFGANKAGQTELSAGDLYTTVTPAGIPGPADVSLLYTDGDLQILPEAFSYGPTILEVAPNAATAEGGGTGIVYGYGFGSTVDNSPIPTDLQITVGGKAAVVTGYAPNAYGLDSPPFNLEAAAYTIPAGTEGTSVDVAVTSSSGTATSAGALSYLPAVQQYSLVGANLAQGIYDTTRDVYYFTDAAEIRVFSKTQGEWLAPIQVPAAPAGTTHRLWGIALSPDGSKLAVSDTGDAMIYLLDPGSPASVQSFPVSTYFAGIPYSYPGVTTYPAGLAVSNAGNIYFAAFITAGDGYDGFFKLDTSTGAVTDYRGISLGGDLYRVAITSDNSTVFFNNDGAVFSVNTATDKLTYASVDAGCCYGEYDLTLSADNSTLEATSYLYDTNLNAQSYLVLNDREALNITYVDGTKLSPDGSLLFQPSTNGIDVIDGRLGTLRARIALPFALSQNYDALVSDGTDDALIAITGQYGSGIAVVDLSSIAEPAALPYLGTVPRLETAPSRSLESSAAETGKQNPANAIKHATNGAPSRVIGVMTRP